MTVTAKPLGLSSIQSKVKIYCKIYETLNGPPFLILFQVPTIYIHICIVGCDPPTGVTRRAA